MKTGDNIDISKLSPAKQEQHRRKMARVPARTVYIGLRRYDPAKGKAMPCNGLAIRAFDFTPEEVHAAIIDGLKRLAADYQRKQQEAQKGEPSDGEIPGGR